MFVCHDSTGFYALTLICNPTPTADIATSLAARRWPAPRAHQSLPGFVCTCHRQRLRRGAVTQGPRLLRLEHFKLMSTDRE